jgi:hypothetical protein
MILANTRGRLGDTDLRLVILALAQGRAAAVAAYRARAETEGPDALLDEPRLLAALLALRSLVLPSPALFAYVAVRHTLRAAGVDDRDLADYLAALLLEFGDHDRHARIRKYDDQSYRYLVDLMSDLADHDAGGERAFLLQVHLGNFALWHAGLFPARIAAQRERAGGPDLPYYDRLGRHGFQLAADHAMAQRYGVEGLYRQAAERFSELRGAFNRLSDEVFFPRLTA